MRISLGALAAAGGAMLVLAGCAGELVTSPDELAIEPFRLKELRAPQAVGLKNAFDKAVKHEVVSGGETWVVDLRQLTDTAIAALRRALEKHGIHDDPASSKAMTLRLQVRGASVQNFAALGFIAASARVTLEVQFADGTAAWVEGEGGSAFGATRAFEAAILAALHRLLIDAKFIAYVNR